MQVLIVFSWVIATLMIAVLIYFFVYPWLKQKYHLIKAYFLIKKILRRKENKDNPQLKEIKDGIKHII